MGVETNDWCNRVGRQGTLLCKEINREGRDDVTTGKSSFGAR